MADLSSKMCTENLLIVLTMGRIFLTLTREVLVPQQ